MLPTVVCQLDLTYICVVQLQHHRTLLRWHQLADDVRLLITVTCMVAFTEIKRNVCGKRAKKIHQTFTWFTVTTAM